MNGLDPIIATTLATRIDSLLNAVSGSIGSTQPYTGAPETVSTPATTGGAGTNQTGQADANQAPSSAQTSLSNTALTLAAILRLDAALLSGTGPQQQTTTLLPTPPSQAGEFTAADEAASGAQTAAQTAAQIAAQATEAGVAQAALENPAALLDGAVDGSGAASASLAAEADGAEAAQTANLATAGTAASALAALATPGSDALSAALNNALQQTLGTSGLFYESHLAQWLSGERSSDSLQNEPQAQLGNGTAAGTAANAAQNGASPLADKLSESITNFFTASAASGGEANAANAAALSSAARSGIEQAGLPLHPDSIALVRQQLDLLATSNFQWSGQAWPGTSMNWEIERRDGDAGAAPDGTQVWHTRISLELPNLGKVDAVLALSGSQLSARVTANPQSAATLSGSSNEFRRRTAAAGIDLTSLQIRRADESDAGEAAGTAASDGAANAAKAPAFSPSPDTAVLLQAYARGGRR